MELLLLFILFSTVIPYLLSGKPHRTQQEDAEAIAESERNNPINYPEELTACDELWEVSKPKPIADNRFISKSRKIAYLQSDTWKQVRQQVITRDKVCVVCGNPGMDIHHIKYNNLATGSQNEVADCCYLCRHCHNAIHNKLGYNRKAIYPITILKGE